MKYLLVFLFLPLFSVAHPGIGIVKDSKGNIYYTDLEKVWKITDGKKTIAVHNVHTHELYIDKDDNLYGENEQYLDQGTNRFDHMLWRLTPTGKLETVIPATDAYASVNFSFSRDREGNEYYTKQFLKQPEWRHIYQKQPDGKERVFAYLNTKAGAWLHVQDNGSILFTANNHIYRATSGDTARIIARNIGAPDPHFYFMKTPVVYGIWSDTSDNIYAAVYSDQAIKKISPDGSVTEIYHSSEHWGPTHGLFDENGKLWVLEASDENAVRVVEAGTPSSIQTTDRSAAIMQPPSAMRPYFLTGIIASLSIVVIFVVLKMRKSA